MSIIETNELVKNYGDLCAVDHVTLSIGKEVFGLLGPNGSGKTTTVLMLTTLLCPTSGTASICGYDIQKQAEMVRSMISYVPQDMAVDIKLTGRENVIFFAKLYGIPSPKDKADEALALMELNERADDLTRTYSGGMRRRLELAQALVHEPSALFLDEPTLGLDVAARKKIWEHIGSLSRRGMSIFVTTHYMDEADRFCDRVGIINNGKIAACGTPLELKAKLMNDVITVKIEGTCQPPDLEGVWYVGKHEDEISFTAENGKEALPTIAEALTRNNVKIRAMSLREPTLDDVFLQAVGQQEEPYGFADSKFRIMLRRRK
ncbi:MAG: ATP-binding cassette domain-containing protein [Methanolinea sp.]|jgi:ABC-2 type transport system ATP-binding protein|nr:ATP-binding cassette domain-containing protein [Methanolinea sp.]